VLDQMHRPEFIIADTMDLWINIARADLEALLKRVDMLILNDSEARLFTGENNLIKAGHHIQSMGPRYVAIKKGEHGCLLFGQDEFFSCPAYPLETIHDPTGAGDTFAGGLAGHLAAHVNGPVTFADLRHAVVYGSVLASFNVEAFSLERLRSLLPAEIESRYKAFRSLSQFEDAR
jgi:sugar/nucleoside kinase (ribokinase family)